MFKKMMAVVAFAAVCLVSNVNATWTAPFTIGKIKNVNDGRIIFTNAANTDQYQFDGQTILGQNMLSSLLTCKAIGRTITVNTTGVIVSPNWWSIDHVEIQN